MEGYVYQKATSHGGRGTALRQADESVRLLRGRQALPRVRLRHFNWHRGKVDLFSRTTLSQNPLLARHGILNSK